MSPHKSVHIISLLLIISAYGCEKFSHVVVQCLERENKITRHAVLVHKSLVNATVLMKWDISANEKHYHSDGTCSFWSVKASDYDVSM